jgi:CxxC-x17-CxxC domain-containing protein
MSLNNINMSFKPANPIRSLCSERPHRGCEELENEIGSSLSKSEVNSNMYNREPKEMHKTVCDDCKKECEVPFKPTEGRPVYCRDCFSKHKPERR